MSKDINILLSMMKKYSEDLDAILPNLAIEVLRNNDYSSELKTRALLTRERYYAAQEMLDKLVEPLIPEESDNEQ